MRDYECGEGLGDDVSEELVGQRVCVGGEDVGYRVGF